MGNSLAEPQNYNGYKVYKNGFVISPDGDFQEPFDNGRGYLFINLVIDGKSKLKAHHRLIAECFVPNPDNLKEVNHKDTNKKNNESYNLEWCTRGYNIKHAYDNNLRSAKGENNARARITEADVHGICSMIQDGYSCSLISEILDLPYSPVRSIKARKNWTYISDSYCWPKIKGSGSCRYTKKNHV